jgi:CheY-like chemotaxis protein
MNHAPSPQQAASTILVVEDEVLVRMAISQYLRECGYRVIEAVSADEALQVLRSEISIDLVFSDVEMPGSMDGFGLVQWIRKNKEELEIILAGSPERAAKTAGELCESGPTMAKPYEPQILLDAIRKQLGMRANRASL